jgi:hypothetical protein
LSDAAGAYGKASKAYNAANLGMKVMSPQQGPAPIRAMPQQRPSQQPNGFSQPGAFSQAARLNPAPVSAATPMQLQTTPTMPTMPTQGMPQTIQPTANQVQQQMDEMRRQQMLQQGYYS